MSLRGLPFYVRHARPPQRPRQSIRSVVHRHIEMVTVLKALPTGLSAATAAGKTPLSGFPRFRPANNWQHRSAYLTCSTASSKLYIPV
jgi:hypothetical protein